MIEVGAANIEMKEEILIDPIIERAVTDTNQTSKGVLKMSVATETHPTFIKVVNLIISPTKMIINTNKDNQIKGQADHLRVNSSQAAVHPVTGMATVSLQ